MNFIVGLNDLLLISPLIALFLFSLIPITVKVVRGNREQNPAVSLIQALIGIMVAAGLLIVFGEANATAFNSMLAFDGISKWMGLVALGGAAAGLVLTYDHPGTNRKQFSELMFLGLNTALGMLVLVSAIDLLTVFIGLEMMSLPLYLMIAMGNEQKLSKEAALKYFILGSFASAVFLYGVALIFGATGGTNILSFIERAPELIQTSSLFLFGICLALAGFFFKVSIVPFHAWTPDVYQGAPTPLSGFMATAIKTVSFAALLRIIATRVLTGSENLLEILQWLAVITMIVGNTAAILQSNLKRMIAYSSIAHSGYLLVGIITLGVSDIPVVGAAAVIYYLMAYGIMTIGAFAIAGMLERSENHIVSIDDLAGFAKARPILALSFAVLLFSLAGIPPFMGFFGKFYLFNAAIGEGFIWLAVWAFISSVVAAYYYLRPVVVMYMHKGESDIAKERGQFASILVAVIMALLVAFIGIMSGPVFQAIEKSLI